MEDPVDYVNPLMGTASTYELSTGNTYPAIALPWGMNFWTPQTGANGDGWTYTYSATKIRGLKQTHQPSPWINDYGSFSIMPVTTGPVYDEEGRQSWFSHKAETVKPYYYQVYLAEHDVVAELAPTERAAAFRLTYPEKEMSYLVVDAYSGGNAEVIGDRNMIVGYSTANHGAVTENFRNWFVVVSDTPFETQTVDGHIAMVGFKTVKGQKVNLRSPRPGEQDGTRFWAASQWRMTISTICAHSIPAFTGRSCSHVICPRSTRTAKGYITALTTEPSTRAICSVTPVSGTHSDACSRC